MSDENVTTSEAGSEERPEAEAADSGASRPKSGEPGAAPPGVVVVGASAGGLAALEAFLASFGPSFRWPIVIAQHMDPTHETKLHEILGRFTRLAVEEAQDGVVPAPGTVYTHASPVEVNVAPSRALALRPVVSGRPERIDHLFTSAAEAFGENAVGVILSGTGSDGTAGALALKKRGGTVIAESEASAQHFGMPSAAIRSGVVDFVVAATEVGPLVERIVSGNVGRTGGEESDFAAILDLLKRRRGTTFDAYRPPTIHRRLRKRVLARGLASLKEYRALLEAEPAELDALFDTLLINVTEFFRDPDAWEALRTKVIPQIVAARRAGEEIRIWSAGCATGEEAYSLAMLVAEALGDPSDWQAVKVFATDIDAQALAEARAGRYDEARLANVSPERLRRFFEPAGQRHVVSKAIRRMVLFGLHDLTKDPPIGRLDLVVCRNTLIYFDTALQRRLIALFRYSLNPGGFLFLGRSEAIPLEHMDFGAVERASRIFQKSMVASPGVHFLPKDSVRDAAEQRAVSAATRSAAPGSDLAAVVHPLIAETANVAAIVLAPDLTVRHHNRHARSLMSPAPQGAPDAKPAFVLLSDPGVREASRSALASGRRARLDAVKVHHAGRDVHVEALFEPFTDAAGVTNLLILAYDVTSREEAREALRQRSGELQQTIETLQSTNEALQSANEELVTANEELQSSNEELATLNEELQSTNEELETTNEELQSTNEELETTNAELRHAGDEVDQLTETLLALLDVTREAIIACGPTGTITLWSPRAREMFGHRAEDVVGSNVHAIHLPLPPDRLRDLLARAGEARAGVRAAEADATPRTASGGERHVTIRAHARRNESGDLRGFVLAAEDRTSEAAEKAASAVATAVYHALLRATGDGVLLARADGVIVDASERAAKALSLPPLGPEGGPRLWDLADDTAVVLQLKGAAVDLSSASRRGLEPRRHTIRARLKDGREVQLTFVAVGTPNPPLVVLVAEV